jgi:hypothetical protein
MAKKKSTRAARGGKITKIEGVRRALAELGSDATPTVIQGFVKDRFGIEMTKDHVSVSKGQLRRQAAMAKPAVAAKAVATKTKAKPPVQPSAASASPAKGDSGKSGIQLEDIAATKALLGRVGVEELRKLIDLLAV